MAKKGVKKGSHWTRHTLEEKAEAVWRTSVGGESINRVAKDMGIRYPTVYYWCRDDRLIEMQRGHDAPYVDETRRAELEHTGRLKEVDKTPAPAIAAAPARYLVIMRGKEDGQEAKVFLRLYPNWSDMMQLAKRCGLDSAVDFQHISRQRVDANPIYGVVIRSGAYTTKDYKYGVFAVYRLTSDAITIDELCR